ncbi:MAG: glycosyltransferase family 39 protein [Oryzomonas sp.]|jgi:hypothetical protein
MICVPITILIVSSYYLLLSSLCTESVLNRVLVSAVLACSQIVFSELLLGLFDRLYLQHLLWLNVALSALVIVISLRQGIGCIPDLLRHDVRNIAVSAGEAFDGCNASLALLFFFTYGWIVLSAFYLPIRGVDDLYYHLPPLFEYIQSHGIRMLPVDAHTSFAFPENAELLFMWPIIFSSSQSMLSCLNVPFVVLSIAAAYALFRYFCASRSDSLFSAFLYALCPVVIMQAGTNYIDIIVSLFLLISLYFVLKFRDNGNVVYLYAASAAIGLVCGMKYTALFLSIPLQFLALRRIRSTGWPHVVAALGIAASLCGWWYVRNASILGDPFYPMGIAAHLFGRRAPSGAGLVNLQVIGYNLRNWFLRYPLEDVGLGSHDGGFGLAFWGVAFPAWIYVFCHSLFNARKTGMAKLFVLFQLPLGFAILLLLPKGNITYAGRFSIFVVAIGLLALCLLFELLKDRVFTISVKVLCIIFSVMTVSLMSVSVSPSYSLSGVLSDRLSNKRPSKYKYLKDSLAEYAEYRYVFEPLDLITRDDPNGLDCFVAARTNLINAAPVYGDRLQNRVLNFRTGNRKSADVYLYFFSDRVDRQMGKSLVPQDIRIYDSIGIHDILTSRNYVMVSHSGCACLLLRTSIAARAGVRQQLSSYYRDTWPEAVAVAQRVAPELRKDIPLVTSNHLGYGLRYLDYSAGRPDRVIMTLEDMEEESFSRMDIASCYTLGRPLKGCNYSKVANMDISGKTVALYINTRIEDVIGRAE